MSLYLDNAATSCPKPASVHQAVAATLREVCASPGRGGYRQALAASRLVFEAREAVAALFRIADSSRVVFTASCTEALNLALFGTLVPGDRVVTSVMEHNAVLRPLRALAESGVQVVKVPADAQGLVDPEALRRACREGARMVVLSHCSNVTGTLQAIEEIGPWCRREGILLCLDAAQSAGVFPLDVELLGVDLLAAPGHKALYGPPGCGFLYLRPGLSPRPLIYGGTGGSSVSDLPPEELPERYEAGTLNTPALAGLAAGIAFLQGEGLERIRARELALLERLLAGLGELPEVTLHGPREARHRGAVVSFNVAGRDPAEIGYRLDHQFDIACRVGLHCAPEAHRAIGTFPRGTVRVSPGYFTRDEEIDHFVSVLASIIA